MESHLERIFRRTAFWAAAVLSVTFLAAVIIATFWAFLYVHAHPPAAGEEHMGSLAATYAALLIIAGAIFSGVFFGWRKERQEASQRQREMAKLSHSV